MPLLPWRFPLAPLPAVLLSSVLQTVIFPVAGPLPQWRAALAWVALVPWFWLLLGYDAKDPRLLWKLTGWSYLCGALWNLGHCYWVYDTMADYGGMSRWIAALILLLYCLYLGLYHAMFGAAAAVLRRWPGLSEFHLIWMLPAVWIALEMGRAHVTSVPWDLLGYSQVDHAVLTRLAPYAGTYAIAFLIVAANTVFALAVVGRGKVHPYTGIAVTAAVALFVVVGFAVRPARPAAPESAVLVQPDLQPGSEAGTPEVPLLQDLTARSVAPEFGEMTGSKQVSLIAWPEAPSPFQVGEAHFDHALAGLARQTGASVISGATAVQADASSARRYRVYNSAALFTPANGSTARYDKIHLVPFGEFVPYEWLFAFAKGLTEQVGRTDRGQHRVPLAGGSHRYGTFICYESIFADEIRQFTRQGADVLVNLSDDGWYGDTSAPFQHMNMARMRAIENRRWLLRDTNTGVTASIDPYGTVREQAPRHVRTSILVHFAYNRETTFYTRNGDVFAYACTAIALALLLYAVARQAVPKTVN